MPCRLYADDALDRYANSRHTYSFPRVVGMLGDGKTSYDQANDGEGTHIGACSANYRRTNVATKAKITYIKDAYLNLQMQYKACASSLAPPVP